MQRKLVFVLILLMTACQVAQPQSPLTGQQVIERFTAAGLAVSDAESRERQDGSPLPNTYNERIGFVVAEVTPDGGQIFVCDTKEYCDTLMAYFRMLEGLAGPYLYQSPNGRVVAQLNSGLTTATAEKFQKVIEGLP